MKRVVLLLACSWLLVQQVSAGTWIRSVATAQKKAKEKNQLIFVDLYADWCGWCHRMEQEVFPSQAFQSATDKMVLLRLNTEDGGEGSQFARQFQISSLPTFLVLSSDMLVAGVIRGYAPAAEFSKSVSNVEVEWAGFLKRIKQEGSIAGDYKKRLDLAHELIVHHGFTLAEPRLRKLTAEKGVPPNIRDSAYYELAISQMLQQKYNDSLLTIRKLGSVSTKGDAVERSRLLAGEVYLKQGNLMAAANEYRTFKTTFPNSPLVRNVDMFLPSIERELAAKK